MCGRYYLKTFPSALYKQLGLTLGNPDELRAPPRYNIAPTQPVQAVREVRPGVRELALLHWGLIPGWAKEPGIGARMINARAETVAEKPSFRNALRRRRCLIPADGYYEWQARAGGPKQPFAISRADGETLAFAGLWEHWQGPNGEELESCAILTTDANAQLQGVHHRMPVILAPEDYAAWLAPGRERPDEVLPLLAPRSPPALRIVPVSTYVNNARHEGPQCIEPLADASETSPDAAPGRPKSAKAP